MMKLSSSGGFTRITVRISDDIPQSKCDTLLHNLQVRNFLESIIPFIL